MITISNSRVSDDSSGDEGLSKRIKVQAASTRIVRTMKAKTPGLLIKGGMLRAAVGLGFDVSRKAHRAR